MTDVTTGKTPRTGEAWAALEAHAREMGGVRILDLFACDPRRASRHTLEACGLVVDAAKQRVDDRTLALLHALARAAGVEARRDAMFAGEPVNATEGRAALHVALRRRGAEPITVGGVDVMPEVRAVLARMRRFTEAVRGGAWQGATGRPVRAVVNLGIGGSDLGPAMAASALEAWRSPHLVGHFVSNLDAAHVEGVLAACDPETTLFLVASKTFTTEETLANARTARRWLVDALGEEAVPKHFVALSTAEAKVRAFGIDPAHAFPFWDWVGGRYSLWSAIGLSVALLVGMDRFEEMLGGAHAMDEHFRGAPLEANLPVRLALLRVWNTNLLGATSHAVLPYDWALRLLPAHLQQLEMESNGKGVTLGGAPVPRDTGPVVWGGPGNNGQHAYYQLLHQGPRPVPVDFLVALQSQARSPEHQTAVLANAFAQAEALMRGRTAAEAAEEMRAAGVPAEEAARLAPHKAMAGNRPSTTILYPRLTPAVLGSLVALYEHAVFVQAAVWGINPFDQWGVELGKKLASRIRADLGGEAAHAPTHDGSTAALIARARAARG